MDFYDILELIYKFQRCVCLCICYFLLQFSTNFYKVQISGIYMKMPRFRLKKKSGIRGEIQDFLSKTFYNITLSRFSRQMSPAQSPGVLTCQCQLCTYRRQNECLKKAYLGTLTNRIQLSRAAGRSPSVCEFSMDGGLQDVPSLNLTALI